MPTIPKRVGDRRLMFSYPEMFLNLLLAALLLNVTSLSAVQLSGVIVESEQGSFLINNLTVDGAGAEKSFRVKWNGSITNSTGKEWHKVTFCAKGFEADGKALVASGESCLLKLWMYGWKSGSQMQWKGSQKIRLADGKRRVALARLEISVSELLTDPENVLTFSQTCSRVWSAAVKTFMDSKFRPTVSDKETFIASFEYTGGQSVAGAFGDTNQLVKAYTATKVGWLASWKTFRIDSASLMLRRAPDEGCRAQIDMSFAGFQKGWYKLGTNYQYEKALLAKINNLVGDDYEQDLDEAISKLPTSAPSTSGPEKSAEQTPLTAISSRSFAAEAGWEILGTWSGNGPKNTDDFAVSSQKWRIRWRASPKNGRTGTFQLTVRRGNERVGLAASIANESGGDTTYYRGAGEHWLEVGGVLMNWTVTVEQEE